MMSEHIFILGKNKELSIAEIVMYFRHRCWNLDMRMIGSNAMLVKGENVPDADTLGGTLKVVSVYDKLDNFDPYMIDAPKINENGKVVFGISVYGKSNSWLRKNIAKFKTVQANVKDILKSRGINSRFVKFTGEINNVTLSKKSILDLVIFFLGDSVYLGVTKTFSNPLEYKRRDEKKPETVSTMGIPIRLARIMLNLAGVKKNSLVVDPFCGTGIILQEALLSQAKVFGADLDKDMIKKAKKNISWLIKKYKLDNPDYKLVVSDASEFSRYLENKADILVTEPYFGPALKKISSQKTAKHMVNKTVILYNEFMKQASIAVKKGGYACITVPSYRTREKNVHINFRKILTRHGFEEVEIHEDFEQPFREEKKTLAREIFLIRKI